MIKAFIISVVVVAVYDIFKTNNPDKLFHQVVIEKFKSLFKK